MQETQEIQVLSLGWEDTLEEEMTIHSSILAWEIPWMEKTGRLQGSLVGSRLWGLTGSDTTEAT